MSYRGYEPGDDGYAAAVCDGFGHIYGNDETGRQVGVCTRCGYRAEDEAS
ncbi:MAG: hypothetical protein H0X35_14760 [Pseudonocardiales bacterium]|nr:hypothetical protein [Pseudonocardiales bacterium]